MLYLPENFLYVKNISQTHVQNIVKHIVSISGDDILQFDGLMPKLIINTYQNNFFFQMHSQLIKLSLLVRYEFTIRLYSTLSKIKRSNGQYCLSHNWVISLPRKFKWRFATGLVGE